VRDHVVLKGLDRISPLAVPILVDIGRERVGGETDETLLREAADALVAEAMG
jgi:ATP-dependent Lhr-like helicase